MVDLALIGPKRLLASSIPDKQLWIGNGSRDGERHGVLAFPGPGRCEEYYVVDMTMLQYGEAGRGSLGENYYLGFLSSYLRSMEKICNKPKVNCINPFYIVDGPNQANVERLGMLFLMLQIFNFLEFISISGKPLDM